jgi:hypothetical protein
MSNDNGGGGGAIPDAVFQDLESHPALARRWVQEPAFRQGLLNAPDVAGFLTEANFALQPATLEWIEERIRFRGTERLAGPTEIVAF